jgi:hypothetical protein
MFVLRPMSGASVGGWAGRVNRHVWGRMLATTTRGLAKIRAKFQLITHNLLIQYDLFLISTLDDQKPLISLSLCPEKAPVNNLEVPRRTLLYVTGKSRS